MREGHGKDRSWALWSLALIGLAMFVTLLTAAVSANPAAAFSCGYMACGLGGGYGGGLKTTIAAKTFSSAGGTVSGSAFGLSVSVVVPAGSLPHGGEVVIAAGPPDTVGACRDTKAVADVSVFVINPDTGAILTGRFTPPLQLTITGPSIAVGDTVIVRSGLGLGLGLGLGTEDTSAKVTRGSVVVALSTDESVVVLSGAPFAPCRSKPYPVSRWAPHNGSGRLNQ